MGKQTAVMALVMGTAPRLVPIYDGLHLAPERDGGGNSSPGAVRQKRVGRKETSTFSNDGLAMVLTMVHTSFLGDNGDSRTRSMTTTMNCTWDTMCSPYNAANSYVTDWGLFGPKDGDAIGVCITPPRTTPPSVSDGLAAPKLSATFLLRLFRVIEFPLTTPIS